MNSIKIDSSTKIVIEYIDKLRNCSNEKRQKVSSVIRPVDFPGISTQQLCDILIRFAYNGTYIDDVFRDHLLKLVVDKSITWNQVIHSVINTKTDRIYSKCLQCELIREMVNYVQIKSFSDKLHADELISIMKPTVFFLAQLIQDVLSDEDELEMIQIEYGDVRKAYYKPLEALSAFIHDDLCSSLLAFSEASEITHQLELCRDSFSKLRSPDKSATTLVEMLIERHIEKCKPVKFQYIPEGIALFDLKNPSIRILIPIFACFKNHESSKLMAETIQTFAEIMRFYGPDVIFDILHGAILLKCEESMDLLHFPKQHRADFRWQSTTFFYKKLPQIIEYLIRSEKLTVAEVQFGLEKALTDLSMMFDAADVAWQNASFLTLLNELEPVLGKTITDPLRLRRREHMKTNDQLLPFADTDNQLIENTDIDKLLNAVKEVMNLQFGQTEEFSKLFVDKVKTGQTDNFDAITSILITEGRLMEVGKAFVLKNVEAQRSSAVGVNERIQIFDDTFILLSRILIKNPSVSINMFVNGGPGKSDAEQTMFYKWSMRYVKRVAKHRDPEPKDETEYIALRKEVEMLMRLANAEVGIEDDLENDVEEEMPEVQEPNIEIQNVDEISIPDPLHLLIENDPTVTAESKETEEVKFNPEGVEQMDTNEKPAEISDSLIEPTLLEEPKDILENIIVPIIKVEAPKPDSPIKKKKDPDVTWHEVHCPLPRISRRTARAYLAQMKEGIPFWKTDDPNLNIGSILAAIPRLGQLLVDEHEEKRNRIDRKSAEENMTNILHAIESMPSLFLCLLEWLDCEPESGARTSLAFTINLSLERYLAVSTHGINYMKWIFIKSTVQQMIDELVDKSPAFPEVTCTAFSTARRFCPFVGRNENPDQLKLKHAWYYMRQQAWASPHALRLLEHANTAREYDVWSHIYISKTIKSGCGDIMTSSVDMIFSFLMLDDLNSIIRIHESLMAFWLSEDAGQCQADGRFDPLSIRVVIRLMTQVLLIAEWTLDRLLNEDPAFVERLNLKEVKAPEPEDPDKREKWIFLLRSMLERTINRFFKIVRKGLLSNVVNTIIQLLKSIAGSADCKAKRLLVKRIPPDLIFQLAYIEPSSVDYSLMNIYCDPDNKEHTQTKIMFLCALRRSQSFSF